MQENKNYSAEDLKKSWKENIDEWVKNDPMFFQKNCQEILGALDARSQEYKNKRKEEKKELLMCVVGREHAYASPTEDLEDILDSLANQWVSQENDSPILDYFRRHPPRFREVIFSNVDICYAKDRRTPVFVLDQLTHHPLESVVDNVKKNAVWLLNNRQKKHGKKYAEDLLGVNKSMVLQRFCFSLGAAQSHTAKKGIQNDN